MKKNSLKLLLFLFVVSFTVVQFCFADTKSHLNLFGDLDSHLLKLSPEWDSNILMVSMDCDDCLSFLIRLLKHSEQNLPRLLLKSDVLDKELSTVVASHLLASNGESKDLFSFFETILKFRNEGMSSDEIARYFLVSENRIHHAYESHRVTADSHFGFTSQLDVQATPALYREGEWFEHLEDAVLFDWIIHSQVRVVPVKVDFGVANAGDRVTSNLTIHHSTTKELMVQSTRLSIPGAQLRFPTDRIQSSSGIQAEILWDIPADQSGLIQGTAIASLDDGVSFGFQYRIVIPDHGWAIERKIVNPSSMAGLTLALLRVRNDSVVPIKATIAFDGITIQIKKNEGQDHSFELCFNATEEAVERLIFLVGSTDKALEFDVLDSNFDRKKHKLVLSNR